MFSYTSSTQGIRHNPGCIQSYSSSLAPINTLPPEILIRIFHLVFPEPCGINLLHYDKEKYPIYPEYLAQVCALWRETVLSSCSLWCHIDLSRHETYYNGLVNRAKIHVARAGELPLELHITDYEHEPLEILGYISDELCEFVSLISPRIITLEFVVTQELGSFHRSIFNRLLSGTHLALRKLAVRCEGGLGDTFIYPSNLNPGNPDHEFFLLDFTSEWAEAQFAPLTVLQLYGVYPLWSSTAYHKLVDLRLLPASDWTYIGEAELITILGSSPGLQILHFGLLIKDLTPFNEEVTPVHLPELRALKVFPDPGYGQRGINLPRNIFRLLVPGSKPLKLCLGGDYEGDTRSITYLERVIAQSQVSRLYVRNAFPLMSLLLRYADHIDIVVLNTFSSGIWEETHSTWPQVDELAPRPRLGSLHVVQSVLSETHLNLLLDCCPDGIAIQSCMVTHGSSRTGEIMSAQELLDTFPTVGVTEHAIYSPEDPTRDWDILD